MFHPVKRNSNVVYADPFAHIFESFFGDSARCKPAVDSRLAPQFEIAETDTAFSVVAELPGIGKENVEIVVDDDVLTVKGEKKAEEKKAAEEKMKAEERAKQEAAEAEKKRQEAEAAKAKAEAEKAAAEKAAADRKMAEEAERKALEKKKADEEAAKAKAAASDG